MQRKYKKKLRKPFRILITLGVMLLSVFTCWKVAISLNPAFAYLTDKSILIQQIKTGTWNYTLSVDAGGITTGSLHDYQKVYRIGTWNGKQGVTLLQNQESQSVITLSNPTLQGYTFTGWTADKNNQGTLNGNKYTIKPYSKDKITANWKPNTNTKYTVYHQLQRSDGSKVTKDTDYLTGTTDTDVSPATKKYYGYVTPAKQTITIKPDGTSSLTYVYKATSDKSEINETFTSPTLKNGTNDFTKDVKVKNTSSDSEATPDWVRVYMEFSSSEARDASYLSSDNGATWYKASDFKNHLPSGWVYESNGILGGYYYYTGKLNKGASTPSLINKVRTISNGNVKSYEIYVYSESTKDMDANGNAYANYTAVWNDRLGG